MIKPSILRNAKGQIWLNTATGEFQLGAFFITLNPGDADVKTLTVGWDAHWLTDQEPLEQCRSCSRWVKSACHDGTGFQENGPWDYSCEANLFPWRFE